MVEQFIGSWTLTVSENFDEYMKAIGELNCCKLSLCVASCLTLCVCAAGVGFATRQMGNMAKPNLVISVGDGGVLSMKSESTFKTTEIKFKLNEEFEETTADGRKTKTTITLEKKGNLVFLVQVPNLATSL